MSKLFLTLAGWAFFAASGFAADWIIPRTTYYITAEQQAFPDFPAPPPAGSKKDREDLAALKEWQLKRTPEECARANAEAYADYNDFYGEISPFPRPLPETAAVIFKRVKAETDGVSAAVKEVFKRPRPFLRDAALEPCLGRIDGLAYPSGHAAISRLFARMLADLVPSKKKKFFARADEAALDRVIGGVHHPSDIEAGKRLADELYRSYKKSRAFRADMETLRGLVESPALKK
jgi:acid phosphatase (class A)